eukprot:2971491-Pleurochrysis_carterae.AAC.3
MLCDRTPFSGPGYADRSGYVSNPVELATHRLRGVKCAIIYGGRTLDPFTTLPIDLRRVSGGYYQWLPTASRVARSVGHPEVTRSDATPGSIRSGRLLTPPDCLPCTVALVTSVFPSPVARPSHIRRPCSPATAAVQQFRQRACPHISCSPISSPTAVYL